MRILLNRTLSLLINQIALKHTSIKPLDSSYLKELPEKYNSPAFCFLSFNEMSD